MLWIERSGLRKSSAAAAPALKNDHWPSPVAELPCDPPDPKLKIDEIVSPIDFSAPIRLGATPCSQVNSCTRPADCQAVKLLSQPSTSEPLNADATPAPKLLICPSIDRLALGR